MKANVTAYAFVSLLTLALVLPGCLGPDESGILVLRFPSVLDGNPHNVTFEEAKMIDGRLPEKFQETRATGYESFTIHGEAVNFVYSHWDSATDRHRNSRDEAIVRFHGTTYLWIIQS